jgi:hypothetical protein
MTDQEKNKQDAQEHALMTLFDEAPRATPRDDLFERVFKDAEAHLPDMQIAGTVVALNEETLSWRDIFGIKTNIALAASTVLGLTVGFAGADTISLLGQGVSATVQEYDDDLTIDLSFIDAAPTP